MDAYGKVLAQATRAVRRHMKDVRHDNDEDWFDELATSIATVSERFEVAFQDLYAEIHFI